ncbi:membrane protein [Thermosipho sp. 1063]|uniref:DMT family transporter n=1 Tax=unclassified Thermosipho (in: thermotogales) TaxID=2676525 RepID=UPI0009493315|nr:MULTISPECIES: DMT family transporter [unclassified Thermosipho (in: thermotogales)]ANQ54051.1 membrane protein [Thermosipho sp. 1070]APT72496.1 membrane protein [Thermosipho sp. 1063]OOC42676.1 membrane protein [Thermosipho sp. 1074]
MKVVAIINLLIVTLIWGLTFPIQKMILPNISPFAYNAIRFWIATLLSYFIFGRGNKYGIILGVVLGISYATQTWGLSITTSSKSGFITAFYIMLIPVFSFYIEKKKPSKIQVFSFLIAIVGEYLLSGGINSINIGDILTFFCAIFYALHVVLVTHYSKKSNEKDLLTSQFFMVALLNTLFGIKGTWNFSLNVLSVALFTAVFATIYALIAQAKYQKIVGSNTAALIFVGEPIFTTLFSILLLSERLSLMQVFGMILTLLALILAIIPKKFLGFLREM